MSAITDLKKQYLVNYCEEKKYTVNETSKMDYIRLDISNIKEKININLYKTGSLVVGGPSSQLKKEFDNLKIQIENKPEILEGLKESKKSYGNKYIILSADIRNKIKDSLPSIAPSILFIEPTPSEEYRAKLSLDEYTLSITQYNNGTLFLQGKHDVLYDATCDLIEKIATPTDQEVIVRFIASNDDAIEKFSILYTPKLIEQAENQVKNKIGEVCNFLDSYDLKWLIASESLRMVNIPLPEYSPIVMPASKAFEGFAKKLLLKVEFYPPYYFKNKSSTFSNLNNKQCPERKKLEAIESHAGTYLDKIGVCLDTNRNFMMHSDGSGITKIDTFEEASKKLNVIYNDMVDIYQYFKKSGFGF